MEICFSWCIRITSGGWVSVPKSDSLFGGCLSLFSTDVFTPDAILIHQEKQISVYNLFRKKRGLILCTEIRVPPLTGVCGPHTLCVGPTSPVRRGCTLLLMQRVFFKEKKKDISWKRLPQHVDMLYRFYHLIQNLAWCSGPLSEANGWGCTSRPAFLIRKLCSRKPCYSKTREH